MRVRKNRATLLHQARGSWNEPASPSVQLLEIANDRHSEFGFGLLVGHDRARDHRLWIDQPRIELLLIPFEFCLRKARRMAKPVCFSGAAPDDVEEGRS